MVKSITLLKHPGIDDVSIQVNNDGKVIGMLGVTPDLTIDLIYTCNDKYMIYIDDYEAVSGQRAGDYAIAIWTTFLCRGLRSNTIRLIGAMTNLTMDEKILLDNIINSEEFEVSEC